MTKWNDSSRSPCARGATPPVNERFERGLATLQTVNPKRMSVLLSEVSDIAPDFAAFLVEYAYGDIGSRPGLDPGLREFAAVAALTAMGTVRPQLKARLAGALHVGWTVDELVELMMQISVFAGFPAALNGLSALKEVLQERDGSGEA
jgi:4-carboxymuconolactone decarboxylase